MKKYALLVSLVARAVKGFATNEILVRGFTSVEVPAIIAGRFGAVLPKMTNLWHTWEESKQQEMINNVMPKCLDAMLEHGGQIPEHVFDE